MTTIFHAKIREKIADENLQSALDGNVERRLKGRAAALASIPDFPERRQRAHAIRADVIARLDEYLAQFIASVERNGVTVHRAKDAAEALRIVLEIAAASGTAPLLFAKSKSMVSEEIELNHALEKAGHRVVETDLGEYIIQLRHERPSHIITPAVHLRRSQVGQLFAEKLGIPYTEDIPTLTNTARRVLREVFLTADIGISGVNFGVTETGTLTIVTNEGNGRMCTTMPPVHIALMGMERLVPTLDDLALFLSLLPRSATGQKLSVYTHLLHSPRRPGDPDGPKARHLVIVDNGRSRLRNSALREALYCIRCGACLNACPVFRELGGHAYVGADGSIAPYPGPIGSVISPGLLGENFAQLAQASSLCGACKEACPVDIDLPKMLLRVRAGKLLEEGKQPPAHPGLGLPIIVKLALSAYSRIVTHPRLFAAGQRFLGWVAEPSPAFIKVPPTTGWGYSKDFPRPAARPFRARWKPVRVENDNARPMPSTKSVITPESKSPEPIGNLAGRFSAELLALGGVVFSVSKPELPDKVISLLRERGIDRVQMWDSVPGLEQSVLSENGIRVEHSAAPEIRAGITGALAGIAETGTLVIPGGAGFPLTASLVPEMHIAVLEQSTLLGTLPEALRLPAVAASPATALVTGPSRTADIEMTLTIGVHGPGELIVFITGES